MMRVTLAGDGRLRATARDLRRAGGSLRKDLTHGLRRPTEDARTKAQRSIQSLRIRGFRTPASDRFTAHLAGGHIRRRIARVIEADVSTSAADPRARVVVHAERLGNARNVPWLLDTGRPYRHPLPGTRTRWAASQGSPWFYSSIDREPFVRAIDEVLDQTVQQIERGR